jgi:predicted transcriptional regulator
MEEQVERLLADVLNDIVRLSVALFFHDHPSAVEGTERIALRLGRDPAAVEGALKALARAGIVERFELGSGRYVLYAYTQSSKTRSAIAQLSQYYHDDPVLRLAIVRRVMGLPSQG